MVLKLVGVCILCYLLGSINFARIIAKLVYHEDITTKGSGNPGTSNMLRLYGLKLSILTFFLDAIKGLISALLGFFLFGASYTNEWTLIAMYACGLSAVVGHIFPIFTKFKGGKGMATAIGVYAVSNFPALMLFVVIGFLIFYKCKYMSILTLTIVTGTGLAEILFKNIFCCPSFVMTGLIMLMVCLCIFAHRSNFVRLKEGTERKVDFQKLWHGDHGQEEVQQKDNSSKKSK